jgi:hypothetical protein
LENFKSGYISPEAMETFKIVYPKMYSGLKQEILQRMNEFKNISEKQKAELSKILQIHSKTAYTPSGFATLQGMSSFGVQQNMINQSRGPAARSTKLESSRRAQSGVDRVIYRE